MNILITNDDGYEAEGINVLAEKLSEKHSVFIIAPDGNRSAISQGINMYKGLKIVPYGNNKWKCSGTPADCVIAGIKSTLLPVKPDCVVAGINHGANLGTDTIYSGTCGAAREAVMDGVPAVAFSLEYVDGKLSHFNELALFALKNIEKLVSLSKTGKESAFVNVNAFSLPEFKGACVTQKLCCRKYNDTMDIKKTDEGFDTKFNPGTLLEEPDADSDFGLCKQGYISVSLIYSQPETSKVDDTQFSL